jgi:hypothetical protein
MAAVLRGDPFVGSMDIKYHACAAPEARLRNIRANHAAKKP